ncbi:MAG: SMC-Scp complex subunit ScpB [Lachnospiraceae bacterium]|nr:SMC-Scp complex subunit ScpB [Lachnospiraceae bacterium]
MSEAENKYTEEEQVIQESQELQDEAEPVCLSDEEAEAAVEAILFTMGDSVEIQRLSAAIGRSAEDTRRITDTLAGRYQSANCGLMVRYFENAVQLCTKPEQYENLIRIAKVPKKLTLTETQLETLSIIAYRQPVTKAEVEEIRGVSCDHAINRLIQYDLICELGRRDTPGRPILFGTTEQFLRSFGVRSLDDLPSLDALQVEEFKEEAEDEVNTRLGI